MPQDIMYERAVECINCGKETIHYHAHACFYLENTHIPGTECWICSVCGHKIIPAQEAVKLPFFHDK